MKIQVKGHSGCSVNIVRSNGEFFIEKGTLDVKYVPRLLAQFEKQQKAAANKWEGIFIPKIYCIEHSGKQAFAKMEYVYSQNFIDYFETAGLEEIDYFVEKISAFIAAEIKESSLQTVNKDILVRKFNDVNSKVMANPLLMTDNDILSIMKKSEEVFSVLPDQITIPLGSCHGDLTFSNILFNRKGMYLIDFLDSFVETPLMDIVKLRQDTAYEWSRLMYVGRYDKTRLSIVSRRIDCAIQKYFGEYDWFRKYYLPFQLMNFLRVLQYATEEKVVDYLKKIIESLLLKGGPSEF